MSETTQIQKADPTTQMRVGGRGIQLQSVADYWWFAQMAFKSKMCPDSMKSPEQVLIAMQHGAELGLTPMQSLQGIAIINNRPSVWGDLALGLCKSHPQWDESVFVKKTEGEGDKMVAIVVVGRKGGKPIEKRFSFVDAQQAGLINKNSVWKQYLSRMLEARALAFAIRDAFPDALRGLAVAEEVQSYSPIRPVTGDSASSLNAAIIEAEAQMHPPLDEQIGQQHPSLDDEVVQPFVG